MIANKQLPGVIITSGTGVNTLGVIRCFGRRRIPVVYVDSKRVSIARYSKFIDYKLKITCSNISESDFVNRLIDFGSDKDPRMIIIPTGDDDLLLLAKHKSELENVFAVPFPGLDMVNKLVNKKEFYQMLDEMNVPHPRTYFPETVEQLLTMGKEIATPFIIKPFYSTLFLQRFHQKVIVINSHYKLEQVIEQLKTIVNSIMLQEIIPGDDFYEFYGYLDRESLPLAICGWKKLRHYPPDFGSGSFCCSAWQSTEIESCLELLKAIGYYGFINPELKRDPRDGVYKLLEINTRTTLQNRLAAACGADIEYTAYLDATQQFKGNIFVHATNVCWVDDFVDLASLVIQLKRRKISLRNGIKQLLFRKVHSVVASDDILPIIARINCLICGLFKLPGRLILRL